MTTKLSMAPAEAPYFPVESAFQLKPKNDALSLLFATGTCPDGPCDTPVEVGLFFDGTNNNLDRDLTGQRVAAVSDDELKKIKAQAKATGKSVRELFPAAPPQLGPPLPEVSRSHSNVARLYRAFPRDKQPTGFHGYYIQGVGTPFPEIGEFTESAEGKAFAKGGQARIIWALLQVLNAIHRTVMDQKSLYRDEMVGELALAYGDKVGQRADISDPESPVVTHQDWFEKHLQKLRAALDAKPKPHIPKVTVSVFGFSRGGAEAVAFSHFFNQLLKGGKLAGIDAAIRFLGVFDVVASVGGSASVAKTTFMPGAMFDGHWAWANYVDEPLPGCVLNGVHLIAAHEMRMNFPVTRQVGGAVQEYLYPGAHSDVGGGYAAGEQGKGREGQAALLSQIPLAHMYLAARKAGVPLLPYSEMQGEVRADFEIDANLARAWTAYTNALDKQGDKLTQHMGLFYRWRAMRLNTLEATASFQASSAQDQEDLSSANMLLKGDLEGLRHRRDSKSSALDHDPTRPAFGGDYRYRMNQWHKIRANNRTPLDQWEKMALAYFDDPRPLPDEVARFFDDYVHDSFASFYLVGEVTEYDKRARVKAVMKEDRKKLNGFEKKIYDHTMHAREALRKKEAGEAMTPEEAALAQEAEYGTPYPVMRDEDSGDMFVNFTDKLVRTQTATRREGGGYILRRGYYPHSGFIFRRSQHEDELMRMPTQGAAHVVDEQGAALVYQWSDNPRQDIAQLRASEAAQQASVEQVRVARTSGV